MSAFPQFFLVNGETLSAEKIIGRGGNGLVFYVKARDGRAFALKKIKTPRSCGDFIKCHEKLVTASKDNKRCTHVAKIHDVFALERGYIGVLMDCFGGRDVIDLVTSCPPRTVPPATCLAVVYQVLLALDALHKKGIVHCDIKLDNVRFIEEKGSSKEEEEVVVIDFDDCLDMGLQRLPCEPLHDTRLRGTIQYLAPEVFRGFTHPARDLWALGVCMFMMAEGYFPYEVNWSPTEHETTTGVCQNASAEVRKACLHKPPYLTPAVWGRFPPGAAEVCLRMLTFKWNERITAEDALRHPVFLKESYKRMKGSPCKSVPKSIPPKVEVEVHAAEETPLLQPSKSPVWPSKLTALERISPARLHKTGHVPILPVGHGNEGTLGTSIGILENLTKLMSMDYEETTPITRG